VSAVTALPPLARSTVDRAAHHRTDEAWLSEAWKRARVAVVDIVGGGKFLVRGEELVFVEPDAAPEGERWFLGEDSDGTPYFGVVGLLPELPGTRTVNLRDVGHLLNDRDAGLATTAVALGYWHAAHVYAPTSGRPTTSGDAGWVRRDDGGENLWPRTDPAVIMLVHDGVVGPDGRCLLGHNAAWASASQRTRRFSCLAGFVEPGESAEAAVAREVAEEVGVPVSRITYVASQPWPFPGSLMLGFMAYADPSSPIRADATEITHAHWFSRSEVAAVLGGERVLTEDGKRVGLPMSASIASFLIRSWLDEEQ
jgi:NAD+ diphosphatase